MKYHLFDKGNLLVFALLALATFILHSLIFSKQLDYGFRDVDWLVLYSFKLYDKFSLNGLLQEVKFLGVYIPEAYYVGILEKFIGLYPSNLHLVTHIFKIITAFVIYIVIYKIFERKLLAFITSVLYTISYTHAGVLFQLASGGYFLTSIWMLLFLAAYYYSLKSKKILRWSIISGVLLVITLLLKPERMYPLVFLIFLLELFVLSMQNFKKYIWKQSLKRIFLIFLPVMIIYLIYKVLFKDVPTGFAPGQFSVNTNVRLDSIMKGNFQLLIYPFSSVGSIFLYEDYWKILGRLNFQNFGSFLFSLILGPILRLGLVTTFLMSFINKKFYKLTMLIMTPVFIFGLIIYSLNLNWQRINPSMRIHFDPSLLGIPAIFGFYIFVLGIFIITTWIKNRDKSLIPLICGFSFSFLFIFLTWLPSDLQLSFMGPQRYLSIPSLGIGLFISGLLVIVFEGIREKKIFKGFAWMIFLILIPIVYINYQVASKFFDYELTFAGLRGTEQARMKNKFLEITGKISKDEKSLFYFDETADKDNGYFDEGTVIAGFEFWTNVNKDGTLNNFPEPGMMRTNIQCPEHTHLNCIDILKAGLAVEKGQRGIWYKDPIRGNKDFFYPLSNFYAMRFINKDIIDIRQEVLRELGEASQSK